MVHCGRSLNGSKTRRKSTTKLLTRELSLEEGSLTDHLVESTSDVKLIRDELMNILVAARDTTASLLTFMCYFLAIHPEVLKRLREEILTLVAPGESPSYEDIRSLKYLRACLNETLRLFPPAPNNERASVKATTLPRASPLEKPYYMPGPHTTIIYTFLLMHRRKDLWGEDADDFLPDRWLDEKRVQELNKDSFRFLPFNAGPRVCLGKDFAYNQASFVMVKLLQNFDTFELRQKQDAPEGAVPPEFWKKSSGRAAYEQVWPRSAITVYAKGGVWIHMGMSRSRE
ncbi:cytochrome P450 [Cantharellus anzutake]|uniref:cytochrome P450 n=1 Tax=Cantharellus anzutake TaxID=1750568 RepID=UPI0019035482|nr:cytochrome P450 [Cantharellus anzutake]KAF8340601.1 cytochrome P450 [Cantharellus anzutake]